MHCNILTWRNGAGLERDADLLASTLRAQGHQVRVHEYWPPGRQHAMERLLDPRRWRQPPYDVNLFLEKLEPAWFPMARSNILIPNQEWFEDRWTALLPRLDQVWCKTRHAATIFASLGCDTRFTGFSSVDQGISCVLDYKARFLHVAGRSPFKGTAAILRAWRQHPEWPRLTVVQRGEHLERLDLPNVRWITDRISDRQLQHELWTHPIHLCPSEAEGYGHVIGEALSTGALVLTTDAPPMHELVTPDCGVLVPAQSFRPQGLGCRYQVDGDALEQALLKLVAMHPDDLSRHNRAARARYQQLRTNFWVQLKTAMTNLTHTRAVA